MTAAPFPSLRLLLASTVVALAAPAGAHGLDANRLQVVAHEDRVELVATPPAGFVAWVDANRDGLVDARELGAHRPEVLRRLVDALRVTDERGHAGEVERADVSVPRGDVEGRGSDFVRLTVVWRWPTPPRALRVRCGFVGEHPVTVFATRAESRSTPGVLTLLGDGEYASLPTAAAEATLLAAPALAAAPAPPRPPPRRLAAAAAVAALLAVLVAARRARRPVAHPLTGAPP